MENISLLLCSWFFLVPNNMREIKEIWAQKMVNDSLRETNLFNQADSLQKKKGCLSSRKYCLNTNKYNFFHFTLKTSQPSLERNRAHFQHFLGSQHKEFSPSVTTEKWPLSAKWKLSQNRGGWCAKENIIFKGHVITLFSCQKRIK